MKKMECDICGRRVMKAENLIELVDSAKTADIREVCHVCLKDINTQSAKIAEVARKLKDGWLRTWITNLRAKKQANKQ